MEKLPRILRDADLSVEKFNKLLKQKIPWE